MRAPGQDEKPHPWHHARKCRRETGGPNSEETGESLYPLVPGSNWTRPGSSTAATRRCSTPGQMPMPSIALILYHGRPHILDARLVLEGHSRIV
jgi:hypothetical protein